MKPSASGANQTFGTHVRWRIAPNSGRSHAHQRASGVDPLVEDLARDRNQGRMGHPGSVVAITDLAF